MGGAGSAYVTGLTSSTDFPTTGPVISVGPALGFGSVEAVAQATYGGGSRDAFVTQLNAQGSAFGYSTYLGGSGRDSANAIALDRAGNAYVTGYTFSTDFPTIDPIQARHGGGNQDAFVAKIDLSSIVDVMVLYTPKAREVAAGYGGIEKIIGEAVAETNQALVNSNVSFRVRLVHTAQVDYTYQGPGSNLRTELYDLQGTSDGHMDEIHSLRDAFGADLVSLIVGPVKGGDAEACGVGFLNNADGRDARLFYQPTASEAFNVLAVDCFGAGTTFTFAHELGHTMGLRHDRDEAPEDGLYPYSHGYQDPGEAFRTIMSYDCPGGCPTIPHFSNPQVLYEGKPTGIHHEAPDSADAARSLNHAFKAVYKFRDAVATGGDPNNAILDEGGSEVDPPSTVNQITVTAPSGNESWPVGSKQTIRWSSSGITGEKVKIELSRNGGASWETIKKKTGNDGSHKWKVQGPATTRALIRVSSVKTPSVSDVSDGNFTIK